MVYWVFLKETHLEYPTIMRWEGPTNASSSIPIVLGMGYFTLSTLTLILVYSLFTEKGNVSISLRINLGEAERGRVFQWTQLRLNSVLATYWLQKVRNWPLWAEPCSFSLVLDTHHLQLLLNECIFLIYSQIHNSLRKTLPMLNIEWLDYLTISISNHLAQCFLSL